MSLSSSSDDDDGAPAGSYIEMLDASRGQRASSSSGSSGACCASTAACFERVEQRWQAKKKSSASLRFALRLGSVAVFALKLVSLTRASTAEAVETQTADAESTLGVLGGNVVALETGLVHGSRLLEDTVAGLGIELDGREVTAVLSNDVAMQSKGSSSLYALPDDAVRYHVHQHEGQFHTWYLEDAQSGELGQAGPNISQFRVVLEPQGPGGAAAVPSASSSLWPANETFHRFRGTRQAVQTIVVGVRTAEGAECGAVTAPTTCGLGFWNASDSEVRLSKGSLEVSWARDGTTIVASAKEQRQVGVDCTWREIDLFIVPEVVVRGDGALFCVAIPDVDGLGAVTGNSAWSEWQGVSNNGGGGGCEDVRQRTLLEQPRVATEGVRRVARCVSMQKCKRQHVLSIMNLLALPPAAISYYETTITLTTLWLSLAGCRQ